MSSQKAIAGFALVLLALCSQATPGVGCLHLNKSFGDGNLFPQQRRQRGLVLQADGIEHLLLSIDLDLPSRTAGGAAPLGWVIPVPATPITYSVELPADAIEQAATLHRKHSTMARYRRYRPFSHYRAGGPRNSYGGHRQHSVQRRKLAITRQTVGDYDVTLLRPLADGVLGELNEWFRKNDFREVEASHVEYFLRNQFSFVCVKVGLRSDNTGDNNNLELKTSLHLVSDGSPVLPFEVFVESGHVRS